MSLKFQYYLKQFTFTTLKKLPMFFDLLYYISINYALVDSFILLQLPKKACEVINSQKLL